MLHALCIIISRKSMYKEALEIYKKAIKLYPNDNDIMVDLAVFYLRIGKNARDIEYITTSILQKE